MAAEGFIGRRTSVAGISVHGRGGRAGAHHRAASVTPGEKTLAILRMTPWVSWEPQKSYKNRPMAWNKNSLRAFLQYKILKKNIGDSEFHKEAIGSLGI